MVPTGVIDLPSRQINGFVQKRKQKKLSQLPDLTETNKLKLSATLLRTVLHKCAFQRPQGTEMYVIFGKISSDILGKTRENSCSTYISTSFAVDLRPERWLRSQHLHPLSAFLQLFVYFLNLTFFQGSFHKFKTKTIICWALVRDVLSSISAVKMS